MLSKKEVVIVAFLAVLATGLSIFVETGCPKIKCSPGAYCMLPFCTVSGGFPFSYWNVSGKFFVNDAIILIILDFIFYFLILYLGVLVLKFFLKKRK